jgi:hypothetical protein
MTTFGRRHNLNAPHEAYTDEKRTALQEMKGAAAKKDSIIYS